ncbi:MAG: glycosyltransferase [Ginsengibacter sp.]
MKNFKPYDIIHIHLEQPQIFTLPPKDGNGKYIVVWWKEIAMGQFFIESNAEIDEKEYKTKIASAIIGAMESYEKKANSAPIDWKTWLLNHNLEEWQSKMGEIIEPFIPKNFPEMVPISVIICTRNRAESLYRCLSFLEKSTCRPEEIIVVDNDSNDDDTYKIATQFKNVLYVKEPKKGLSAARNTGIKNAKTKVIAFTDDDVQVHPLWTYSLWKSFENEDFSALTGLVITSSLQTESQFIFEKYWSFNRGFVGKIYDKDYFESVLRKGPPVWEIGAGANMAFRKSIFNEVGYFNEFLGAGAAGCSEDSEMWFRILTNGHKILYDPKVVTFHEHRQNMRELKKQIFNYMQGFTVAALVQQKQSPGAGYKKHLYVRLPQYYFSLLKKGFPFYRAQFQTLSFEIRGILSGYRYYFANYFKLKYSLRK